jgi:hypothetical protein
MNRGAPAAGHARPLSAAAASRVISTVLDASRPLKGKTPRRSAPRPPLQCLRRIPVRSYLDGDRATAADVERPRRPIGCSIRILSGKRGQPVHAVTRRAVGRRAAAKAHRTAGPARVRVPTLQGPAARPHPGGGDEFSPPQGHAEGDWPLPSGVPHGRVGSRAMRHRRRQGPVGAPRSYGSVRWSSPGRCSSPRATARSAPRSRWEDKS